LIYKRRKIGLSFLLTLRKFRVLFHSVLLSRSLFATSALYKSCIALYCQASHTEVSERNSTNCAKRWGVNRANKLSIVPPLLLVFNDFET